MSGDWQIKKLRDVCTLINGRAYSKSELLSEGKYPVLRVGNFFTNNNWYHSNLELPPEKYCEAGDLLYAWSASFGPRIWEGDKVIFHYHIWKVQHEVELIDRRYLFYFFEWDTEQIKLDQGTGTTMIHVAKGSMEDRDVPVPSLPTQQRIVAILDEAFEGIATAKANAEKNLQNTRELFTSTLADVFNTDWPQVRIEDACETIMDCVNKTAPIASEPTPYKMLRTTNVRNGLVSLASVNHVTEDVYKVWTRRQVPRRGDVILTREAPMGEVGMLESDEAVFLGQRLVSYRADASKLDGRFLLYALQSDPLQRQIRAKASGSTVQHMRVPDSKNLLLPLPGLVEQKKAVEVLDAMRDLANSLLAQYTRKLAALDELKKSLLHQAFSGQL